AARAVIEVEHGGEADIHAVRGKLICDASASGSCLGQGVAGIGLPKRAEIAHRGNVGKSVAEALDATAFVIHGDEGRAAGGRANLSGEQLELGRAFEVAGEED